MAEITTVTKEILGGFMEAIGEAESIQLKAQVDAAKKIAQGGKVMDVVSEMLDRKAPADFLAAGRLTIHSSMTLSTRRERKADVSGGVQLGAVSIQASYGTSLAQETATNTTVDIEMVRASQNVGVEYMAERLKSIAELFD